MKKMPVRERLRWWGWLALAWCLLAALPTRADHLVGYDWEFAPQAGGQYRVRLTLYTDPATNPGNAIGDPTITIAAYEQLSPARLMDSFTLPRVSTGLLPGPAACAAIGTATRVVIYEALLALNPGRYNSANGYYLVWERCCRNLVVTNLVNPTARGAAALLVFPRLSTIDQTPVFRQNPAGTALCVGAPASISFAATDANRDSLAYTLVPALAGFTSQANPTPGLPNAPPYPPMSYTTGFSAQRPLPGSFSLDARTGLLQGVPAQPGTFAVAVRVEEFRQGRKIGENRREVQLTVAACPRNTAPSLTVAPGTPDTVRIDATNSCLTLAATDPDVGQILTVRVLGNADVTITPATFAVTGSPQTLTVCWPACPPPGPPVITLLLTDNSCSPATDTLRVPVRVTAVPNVPPVVRRVLPTPNTLTVTAGDTLQFELEAVDADGDPLQLQSRGAPPGLTVSPGQGVGTLRAAVRWLVPCEAGREAPYPLWFRVTDGRCQTADSVLVPVRVPVPAGQSELMLPNVITPNADGRNDCFGLPQSRVPGACAGVFGGVQVFNRWGRAVYESADPNFCWDGAAASPGTYFFLIRWDNRAWRGLLTVIK